MRFIFMALWLVPPVVVAWQSVGWKRAAAVVAIGLDLSALPGTAVAFDNALPNTYTMPKSKGPQPQNLGLDRAGLLRTCSKPSPNCFTTTPDSLAPLDEDEDNSSNWGEGDIHRINRWSYKGTPDEAFDILAKTIQHYEVGQAGIDGGGFQIVKLDPQRRYIYVQFESLKRGYIDDFEAAVDSDGSVQVVSSSRLGYLDYQVNAKRLNFIAARLREQGWSAPPLSPASHPVYFQSTPMPDDVRAGPERRLGSKQY